LRQRRCPLRPFPVVHIVLSFLLDLAHAFTRSDHDRALELVCWPFTPSGLIF